MNLWPCHSWPALGAAIHMDARSSGRRDSTCHMSPRVVAWRSPSLVATALVTAALFVPAQATSGLPGRLMRAAPGGGDAAVEVASEAWWDPPQPEANQHGIGDFAAPGVAPRFGPSGVKAARTVASSLQRSARVAAAGTQTMGKAPEYVSWDCDCACVRAQDSHRACSCGCGRGKAGTPEEAQLSAHSRAKRHARKRALSRLREIQAMSRPAAHSRTSREAGDNTNDTEEDDVDQDQDDGNGGKPSGAIVWKHPQALPGEDSNEP